MVPATAAAPTDSSVTVAAVSASLKGSQLTKWKALSKAQKDRTVQALSDPSFGLPGAADALTAKYSDLQVVQDTGTTDAAFAAASIVDAPVTALATAVGRSSWVRDRWTILGITYTEITTTIGYTGVGGTVTAVNRCYNTYANYVPLRSISGNSWYTMGNGLADCWTEWTLARPLQSTVTGIQGLRVNGYGTILKTWHP